MKTATKKRATTKAAKNSKPRKPRGRSGTRSRAATKRAKPRHATTRALKRVAVDSLKDAHYQPGRRKHVGIKQLEQSIADGHRRLQALKNLGETHVLVREVPDDEAKQIYAELNASARNLTGNDNLQVWLADPDAVTPMAAARFTSAALQIGRPMLQKMADEGMSIRAMEVAKKACEYMGQEENREFLCKTIKWMIRWSGNFLIRSYISNGGAPDLLKRCIMHNRRLKAKFIED